MPTKPAMWMVGIDVSARWVDGERAAADAVAEQRQFANTPAGHRQPTILYHDGAQIPCAEAMARTLLPPVTRWAVRPLGDYVQVSSGTIEVWLPRPVPTASVRAPGSGTADGY